MALLRLAALAAATCVASPSSATHDPFLLEDLPKEQLIARLRAAEARAAAPTPPKLWPELMKTPFMMWNGWLPSTSGLIPGFENNESLYYVRVPAPPHPTPAHPRPSGPAHQPATSARPDPTAAGTQAAADRLVSSGLRDLGYDTIAATCMGWERDPVTKRLFANPKKWPRGYKALIDYLHARKLKIAACQHQPPLHLTYGCPLSAASHRRSRAAAGRLGYRGDELLRQRRDEQRQAGAGNPWVRGAGHPAVRGVG